MPDLKHNFNRGRMNKDLDERLVPDGEYRDAENIEIVTSEGSNVGAAQNVLGTTWQKVKTIDNSSAANAATNWTTKFGYDTAECVGSVVDNDNNSIYWFVRATKSSDNPTNTSLIIQYTDKYKIIRPVLVDKDGILNFKSGEKITGINILPAEGKGSEQDMDNVMLFWTDNNTEPKKINVKVFMSGCNDMVTHTRYTGDVISSVQLSGLSSSDNFKEEHITVIKKSPRNAPRLYTYTSTRGTDGDDPVGTGTNPAVLQNFAFTHDPDGDGEFENMAIGTGVDMTFLQKPEWNDINYIPGAGILGGTVGDKIKLQGVYNKDGEETQFAITMQVTKMQASSDPTVTGYILNIPPDLADITNGAKMDWRAVLVEKDPMYELRFPRFAYRWKYKDGEYSCYSPFTQVAFEPGVFDYDIEKGYNLSMVNNIRKLKLDTFDTKPIDVVEVEILCKESNNNLVHLVEVLKDGETELEITSDLISNVVDGNQLLRPWDNVPRKALAQEITGNRVVYGNYLQNYTLNKELEPRITADFHQETYGEGDYADVNILTPQKSIKSIRGYQVGVVYKDEYGRETPILTKSNLTIKVPVTNSNTINSLQASIKTNAPSWAKYYKFFVKDPSNEYYNLVMDRFYNSEDGNVWVSFPSSERNKVQEGDYLILKKQHDKDIAVNDSKVRYKILDVQNEVPEFIARKDVSAGKTTVKVLSPLTDQPKADAITIGFQGPSATENPEFAASFKEGNKIQFISTDDNYKSFKYEIEEGGLTGETVSGNNTYAELNSLYSVTLKTAIESDDDGFANITFSAGSKFQLNVTNFKREILEEHHGRFFVKMEFNDNFRKHVMETMPGAPVTYKISHSQRFRDEVFKYSDMDPNQGESGFMTRANASDWRDRREGEDHDAGICFAWRDRHADNAPSSSKAGADAGTAPGNHHPPGGILNNGTAKFKFFIAGYPGGNNTEGKPEQHVNTNGFTAALQKDALIRFSVGLQDGTETDTIYKSKIYQVVDHKPSTNNVYVRNGVFKKATRRGFWATGNYPTMAARRKAWNTYQQWWVFFKDHTTGEEKFEDMKKLDTANPSDPQSHWSTSNHTNLFVMASNGASYTGSTTGLIRNNLGPDFVEILVKKTIEDNETQKSYNPGIFETEPKENIDLELYHEASDAIPITLDANNIKNIIKVGDKVEDFHKFFTKAIPSGTTVTSVSGTTIGLSAAASIGKGAQVKIRNKDGAGITVKTAASSTGQTITIEATTIGSTVYLPYYNCFTYGNGVESNRVRDDYNQVVIDKGPKVSTVSDDPYREERRGSGLIYSGIFNSTSGVNNTNQFIQGLKITKDLNPEYGTIQKLHSRNTDLITLCEDKVIRVLANKDALYNADGNVNLTATENVLGQAVPYVGEFGIGKNPESFAHYAFRAYFTDKSRGAVLRLSRDGLTNIAEKGMTSYFSNNLPASNLILGSYDEDKQCYNITHTSTTKGKDTTVSFDERVDGWTSFKSYVPENACSLNSMYYSFKNGDLFSHNNNTRNKFYDVSTNQNDTTKDYETSIVTMLNDAPSTIKQFKTLNYEGTQSREYTYSGTIGGTSYSGLTIERLKELSPSSGKQDDGSDFTVTNTKGWYCNSIATNDQTGLVHEFKEKEGIWFNNIIGDTTSLSNLDSQEFSVQGIDNATSISGTRTHGDLTVKLALTTTDAGDTAELQAATHTYPSTNTVSYTYSAALSGTRTLYITPKAGYTLTLADFTAASNPTGVTNITLSQDGERIKAVITLGGSNFTSSGDQTITINIGGIGVEEEFTLSGTYDTDLDDIDDASGNALSSQTNVAFSATGKFGERKLVLDKSFYAPNNGSGSYTGFFVDKPFYEILDTSLGTHNEPGERYDVTVTHTDVDAKHRITRFQIYFTFPNENTPQTGFAEKFKFTAYSAGNYERAAEIDGWAWGSSVYDNPGSIVPQEGDEGRTITVYGGATAKYKLKQTDPDGNVTYLIGDQFTQETMGLFQYKTVAAPIPANTTLLSKVYTYELTGELANPFGPDNPFTATQQGITNQAFSASNASNTNLNISGATTKTVTDTANSTNGNTTSLSWTITPTGSIPMKFYGTQPTASAPLFTNLSSNNANIEFNSITNTFNSGKTSLAITADIDISKHPSADNTSVLDIGSYVKLNEAPIAQSQTGVAIANNTATNITAALTTASQTIQSAEGDTMAYSLVGTDGGATKATVTINSSTGVVTYTPDNAAQTGADTITFKVNDGHQDSANATIGVDIAAAAPTNVVFTGGGTTGSYTANITENNPNAGGCANNGVDSGASFNAQDIVAYTQISGGSFTTSSWHQVDISPSTHFCAGNAWGSNIPIIAKQALTAGNVYTISLKATPFVYTGTGGAGYGTEPYTLHDDSLSISKTMTITVVA